MELWLSAIAGPDDVLAPIEARDEAIRVGFGSPAQNYWIPSPPLQSARRMKRMAGRRPQFSNHMPAEAVRRYIGESVWKSFLKVTVERDRYDRAISMFRWHTREVPTSDPVEFLRRFPEHKLANAPIYSIDGKVVADVVLDFAQLEDDMIALQQLLGVPSSPLPRSKVSAGGTVDSRTLLGSEGCSIVDRACQHDIALTLADKRPSEVKR